MKYDPNDEYDFWGYKYYVSVGGLHRFKAKNHERVSTYVRRVLKLKNTHNIQILTRQEWLRMVEDE